MLLKLLKPLVVFDLETTGLDLIKDKIIQLSYIKIFPDGKEVRKNFLVNPQCEIKAEITELTGITNQDLKNAPTFKDIALTLADEFSGCDFAGFNSNRFDVPMLAEEFLRAGVDFDFSKAALIDVQNIFHKMERRNLSAAYKFYCGRKMEEDFTAHRADEDTEATWRVLQGQLKMYAADNQEDPERVLQNDVKALAEFSSMNQAVDFAARLVWQEVKDENGKVVVDEKGQPLRQEVFNFGKYKGQPVADIIRKDPGFISWVLSSEFTYNTKQAITRIQLRTLNTKP